MRHTRPHDAARVQQASRRSSLGGTGHSVRTVPIPSRAGQMRCMPPATATRCSAAARCSIWSSTRLRQCERVSRAQLLLHAACSRQQLTPHVTPRSPAATDPSDPSDPSTVGMAAVAVAAVGVAAGVAAGAVAGAAVGVVAGVGAKRCVTRRSVSMSSVCLTSPSSDEPGAVARLGLRLTSVSTGCGGGGGGHALGGWRGPWRATGAQKPATLRAGGCNPTCLACASSSTG